MSVAVAGIDWRRVARRLSIVLPCAAALLALLAGALGHTVGLDFRGGMWAAGHAVLAGRSPNPPARIAALVADRYAFVLPPPLAWAAAPLSALPFAPALALWDALSVAALLAALAIAGGRDRRLALVLCALPVVASLGFGQTEGVLALGVALAWRWREEPRGGLALGLAIAAKFVVWPLLVWLLVTRRYRQAAIALATATATLAASWAPIGMRGLAAYPRLVLADADSAVRRTHSLCALLVQLGAGVAPARTLAPALAALVAVAIGRSRADRAVFTAAIAFALLSDPLMEMHYLVLALIPLAIARPRLDALWLVAIDVFWLSPSDPPGAGWQIAVVLAAVVAILARAAGSPRPIGRGYAAPD